MKKAVAIILRNNKNEILFMQRGPHARSQNGKWENCGGEVEPNENPLEAIKREVEEELGVKEIDPKVLFVTKSSDATI